MGCKFEKFFGYSTMFIFLWFLECLVVFDFLWNHTKHPGLYGDVGNFFLHRGKGFWCSATDDWSRIESKIRSEAPLSAFLSDLTRNCDLPKAQKSGYASCAWWFLLNYCTKFDEHSLILLLLNPSCLQVLGGVSNGPGQKILKVQTWDKTEFLLIACDENIRSPKQVTWTTNDSVSEST